MVRLILIAILLLSVSPADAQRRDDERGRYDRHHRHPDHQRWDRYRDRDRPQEQGGGIGDFIGGVIGGIIRGNDPYDECARRYRSYDRRTGFYIDHRGYPRRCP